MGLGADVPDNDLFQETNEVSAENTLEFSYPGTEMMLKYRSFLDFDILLQFVIFFGFLIFIISVSIIFNQWKLIRRITSFVPESVTLLLIGAGIGLVGNLLSPALYTYIPDLHTLRVQHLTIYSILIPPIILHASYDLYHSQFFTQVPSIISMAIIGTLLNTVIIALGLFFIYARFFNTNMNIFQIFTFSSLVAAVDPVAVLAVFEEVNADKGLYFLVFGEALLNDGVTFVLFEGFKELAMVPPGLDVPLTSYLYVLLSFLSAPLGGVFCGAICASISAFLTKYTSTKIKHLEPIIIITLAMLAYVIPAKIGWSSIISLIAAGLVQKRYAFPNLHEHSKIAVVDFVKSIAVTCEVMIFVLLGNSITKRDGWDLNFILLSVLLCYVARAISVLCLSYFLNIFRYEKITMKWQMVIFIGGLRGAIAYTMAISYKGPFREIFIDATLIIIFITVMANGISASPLVQLFDLGDKKSGSSLGETSSVTGRYSVMEHKYILPVLQRRKTLKDKVTISREPSRRISYENGCSAEMEEVSKDVM